jgi:hypothetical protein
MRDPFALQVTIVLDEADVDRILRRMYNGKRPEKIHLLICLCGKWADLWKSPRAWNGWRVLPTAMCPDCLANENLQKVQQIADLYPSQAYERFLKQLEQVLLQKARGQ